MGMIIKGHKGLEHSYDLEDNNEDENSHSISQQQEINRLQAQLDEIKREDIESVLERKKFLEQNKKRENNLRVSHQKNKGSGWHGESVKHRFARLGIKTK